jgi:ribosomal protein S27AE
MATEALKRAVKKYDAANTKQVHLKLNIKTDADIIRRLEGMDNVQGYIKSLIRADMKKKSKSEPLPYSIIEVIDIDDTSEGHTFEKYCPSCGVGFGHFYPPKFCPKCGQHIAEEGVLKETKTIDNRTKKADS